MAGGLVALLDDVALIARTAAASIDDVSSMAGKTAAKAAGVVVDDAAVTPKFVEGVTPARELPIIGRIVKGSLVNKLLIILPIALLLSALAPWALTPLLMIGGFYLAFEGAEKLLELFGAGHGKEQHKEHQQESAPGQQGSAPKDEKSLVKGAIMTDFILSAEIMVISLNEVAQQPLWMRTAVLIVVAIAVTLGVYGVVGLLVKMDDIGLRLTTKDNDRLKKLGRAMVSGMPKLLSVIGVIGTFAMLWVGGHILLVGADELGWHWPHHTVHHLVESAHHMGGAVMWTIETFCSMIFGLIAGFIIVGIVHLLPSRKKHVTTARDAAGAEQH